VKKKEKKIEIAAMVVKNLVFWWNFFGDR